LIQKSYPYRIGYELLIKYNFVYWRNFFMNIEKFIPVKKLNIISDIKDNVLLELADICSADFLITGNTNDFTFSQYKKTRMVRPKEYWDNCQCF
jgi:predicted nucleic acid-binding protein